MTAPKTPSKHLNSSVILNQRIATKGMTQMILIMSDGNAK